MAAGLIAARLLTRARSSMLIGVKATDWPTYITVAAAFSLIALVASWLPARRAAALDPTSAVREE
jgi:putative ABC transport system permease protein